MLDKIKDKIKRLRGRMTPKRIFLAIITVIAVLLPTILAISSIRYLDREQAESSNKVQTVILFDADGKELFRENADARENGDTSLVSIFNTINDNMTKTDKISDSVVTEAPLTVQLISPSNTKTLICHFSFTEGSSYCVDKSGVYYKILSEDSERFLASAFAESLYAESVIPSLSTADGDVIIPSGISWYYRNIESSYLQAILNNTTSELCQYHVTGGISLAFSEMPDRCSVQIYDGSTLVFSGKLDELQGLTLDADTAFSVKINAEWVRTNERRFFGVVDYSFNVSVHNRAVFTLSKAELSAGEYAILGATNISDVSKLTFASDIPGFIPSFVLINEKAYATIPCPSELSESGSYKITVSYGISSQTFTVFADEAEVLKQRKLNMSAEKENVFALSKINSDVEYTFFGGTMLVPTDAYESSLLFGDKLDNDNYSYCTEYKCVNGYGMPISAVSGGKIARVESSENLGTCITVDVGLGMRIIYTHLSSADVSVGEYVAAGDIIGRTGKLKGGMTEGFALMLVCNNTALDVKYLLEQPNI